MERIFEVETRGVLTKQQYDELIKFMDKNADKKEIDNRHTVFFMIKDKTLKVAEKIDQKSAKIALKLGNIATSKAQEEFEISIKPEETETAIKIFENLGFTDIQDTRQNRINYWYKEYEFAIKWSKDLSYHFEAEILINDKNKIDEEYTKMADFIKKELNLNVLTEQEFIDICNKVDNQYK
jgi:adenylate cyclase class IV